MAKKKYVLTEALMLYLLSKFDRTATTTDLLDYAGWDNRHYHLAAHNILDSSQYVARVPTHLMVGNNPVDGWKLHRYIFSSPEGQELEGLVRQGRKQAGQ